MHAAGLRDALHLSARWSSGRSDVVLLSLSVRQFARQVVWSPTRQFVRRLVRSFALQDERKVLVSTEAWIWGFDLCVVCCRILNSSLKASKLGIQQL
ncbi:unnamed protein product [Victoria cruziana]